MYTKGEWRAELAGKSYESTYEDDWVIRSTAISGDEILAGLSNRAEDEANAHLIAAAPELYEALEALLFQFAMAVEHPYSKDKEVCEQAEQALAKAKNKGG